MLKSFSRCTRGRPGVRTVVVLGAFAMTLFIVSSAVAQEKSFAGKWGGPIDPDALQILKGMTDYLGSLQEFALHTENTYDDVLMTGHKIQFGFSTNIVVQRPNKIRAERTEGVAHQVFVYDGAEFSMYEAGGDFFARIDVPDNIEQLTTLPGVGRKTANVILSNAFGVPAISCDTHVIRLSRRLGLSPGPFVACLDDDRTAARLKEQVDVGVGLKLPGPPTYFLDGRLLVEPLTVERLEELLR